MSRAADKALACYAALQSLAPRKARGEEGDFEDVFAWIRTEWEILKSVAGAGVAALGASRPAGKGD